MAAVGTAPRPGFREAFSLAARSAPVGDLAGAVV
jgi:hypothetical protein